MQCLNGARQRSLVCPSSLLPVFVDLVRAVVCLVFASVSLQRLAPPQVTSICQSQALNYFEPQSLAISFLASAFIVMPSLIPFHFTKFEHCHASATVSHLMKPYTRLSRELDIGPISHAYATPPSSAEYSALCKHVSDRNQH